MTSPLILMALGIFFQPRLSELKLVSITVLIRAGIGLFIGFDKDFASKTVSLSILLGIFYVPVLMFWFGV